MMNRLTAVVVVTAAAAWVSIGWTLLVIAADLAETLDRGNTQ